MRITRDNVNELIETIEGLNDELSSLVEAAEAWRDLQDEDRTEETAEDIRAAREDLEENLNAIDVATLCQMIHGKHRASKAG